MGFRVALALSALGLSLAGPAPARAEEQPVEPYVQSNANAGVQPFTDDSTFLAFHGKAGIDRIVDDTLRRGAADPRTADIFKGADMERLHRTLKEYLCYVLHGPCDYTGRDLKTAHKDQGLQNADFNALIEHMQLAMDREGVPFRAQNRLLAKLAPMQRVVVTR